MIKRLITVGTLAITMTMSTGLTKSNAEALQPRHVDVDNHEAAADLDRFLAALGASDQQQISDALYEGRSLADIAEANGKPAQDIIELQVAQLSEQLYLRMASGQLSPSDYYAQLKELPAIVYESVYGIAAESSTV
ncbi:hypothetical protein ACFFK0_16180 [Paenibacillus chartarius]|uniref:Uncharacterized protein n=1 Tax=Paenibacillus chartarius TaxID=747481 RepID=A0ABV6DMU8_9BACL